MGEEELKMAEKAEETEVTEETKEVDQTDSMDDLWEDRSAWNDDIESALPELDRWDDVVKELLPREETAGKEEKDRAEEKGHREEKTRRENTARSEPVVELKSVTSKQKASDTGAQPVTQEKSSATPISDKDLLLLIQKYREAQRICDMTNMPLSTLQKRVAVLSYRMKKYIDVEGLYRDTGPVQMKGEGLLIPKGHFVETGYSAGDQFNVVFKNNYILLVKIKK